MASGILSPRLCADALSRELLLYANKKDVLADRTMRTFVDEVAQESSVRRADRSGSIRLSEAEMAKTRARWKRVTSEGLSQR